MRLALPDRVHKGLKLKLLVAVLAIDQLAGCCPAGQARQPAGLKRIVAALRNGSVVGATGMVNAQANRSLTCRPQRSMSSSQANFKDCGPVPWRAADDSDDHYDYAIAR